MIVVRSLPLHVSFSCPFSPFCFFSVCPTKLNSDAISVNATWVSQSYHSHLPPSRLSCSLNISLSRSTSLSLTLSFCHLLSIALKQNHIRFFLSLSLPYFRSFPLRPSPHPSLPILPSHHFFSSLPRFFLKYLCHLHRNQNSPPSLSILSGEVKPDRTNNHSSNNYKSLG